MELNEKLKARRIELGLSLEQVGSVCKVMTEAEDEELSDETLLIEAGEGTVTIEPMDDMDINLDATSEE